jgi:tetratricopeptide (TPR) repeat protein
VPADPTPGADTSSTASDEVAFLLTSLRDLEAERAAGDIDDLDYQTLKDGYTARAAAAIRSVSRPAVSASDDSAESRTVAVAARPPRRRIVPLVAAGIVAFGLAAGIFLSRSAGTRLPGDNISGSTPTSPAAKLDAEAQTQIQAGNILGAIKSYDAALADDPADAEALAYKGWLLRLAGSQSKNTDLVDTGLASIRKAEQVDPGYPDAHFFAGETLLRDKADPKGAIVEFQQFLADNPPPGMVAEVQLELQSAQAEAAATQP